MRQVYLDDFRNVKVDLTTGLALEVSRGTVRTLGTHDNFGKFVGKMLVNS
jgi:hypothetical protein